MAENKSAVDASTTSTDDAASPGTIAKVSLHDKAVHLAAYLTSRDAWLGDYDYWYLITPNIYPFNKRYKQNAIPFYGLNDEVPILLTIILGLQHALIMIGSIVSPPLAIALGALNLAPAQASYLVSAAFHHDRNCHSHPGHTTPYQRHTFLHWHGAVVGRWPYLRHHPHCIFLHQHALQKRHMSCRH